MSTTLEHINSSSTEQTLTMKPARGETWLIRFIVSGILLVIPLIYFYPILISKGTLAPGDGWTQIFGIRVLIGRMIAMGQVPLWNPYIFSGMPLLASIQPGALYPPTWLFAILSPQSAMNWMVITTYHIALIGTYLYLRRIGANHVGSIVGGVAFAFGGYMIAHLGHTNRVAAAAWLPWIMLAIEALYQRLQWRWVALGAVAIMLQLLAGEPQMNCYTILVAGAYGLFSLTLREARASRLRFLLGLAAMGLCGLLLSAIQLLPERELLQQGERAGITYEYFSSFSFPPQQIFQLIFPYFFGGAGMAPYGVVYWGRWNTTEVSGYVGMLAMILVSVVLIGQFKEEKRNQLVWFWAICVVVSLMLALGSNLPFKIHRILYHVPVYNLFRASGRHLFEFDFALSVLAGLGATWLTKKESRIARNVMAAGIGVMTAVVIFAAIVYRFFADRLVMELPVTEGAKSFANLELIIPIVFFVVSAAALCLYRMWQTRSAILKGLAGVLMIAICLADVASFGFFYEWNIVPADLPEKLADAPTVKFIKDREPNLNSFRIMGQAAWPYYHNY